MTLTEEQIEQFMRDYLEDYPRYAKDFLFIRSPDQRLVPLQLNPAQMICHRILEKQAREKGFVRAIILKARRLGISTYVEGRFYHRAVMRPLQNVYIVSHRDDSCNVLFSMTKLMQEKNPLQPGTYASNRKELKFRATRSEYGFSSADSPEAAKSRDITLFHGSEVAEWRNAEDLLGALMPCLPKPPIYSEAILESTAKGFGNTFQKMVFRAYAEGAHPFYEENGYVYAYENPGYDWILIFFPWFVHSRNVKPFTCDDERRVLEAYLNAPVLREDLGRWGPRPEKELMDRYALTLEQMNWRAWTLRNDCNDDLDKFRQEHPATVQDAFVSTGGNVFGRDLCDELARMCRDPVHIGTLVERSGRVVAKRMQNGPLSIWELPDPEEDYLISIDPAGGTKDLQTDKNQPDYTCMDVWKRQERYLIQVAQWHGRVSYDLIADEAMLLARMYNFASIAVLRMNHGLAVLTVLERESWPRIVKGEDGKNGILEDRKRKPAMVDDLYRALRDGFMHIRSLATVEELRTYIERDKKLGAEEGCNDDRVSSAYCAVFASSKLPRPARTRQKDPFFVKKLEKRHRNNVIMIENAGFVQNKKRDTYWEYELDS